MRQAALGPDATPEGVAAARSALHEAAAAAADACGQCERYHGENEELDAAWIACDTCQRCGLLCKRCGARFVCRMMRDQNGRAVGSHNRAAPEALSWSTYQLTLPIVPAGGSTAAAGVRGRTRWRPWAARTAGVARPASPSADRWSAPRRAASGGSSVPCQAAVCLGLLLVSWPAAAQTQELKPVGPVAAAGQGFAAVGRQVGSSLTMRPLCSGWDRPRCIYAAASIAFPLPATFVLLCSSLQPSQAAAALQPGRGAHQGSGRPPTAARPDQGGGTG